MPATSLTFNNRTTRVPNAYTKVDASALDGPSAGATGRVLVLGTADGGVPYTEGVMARITSSEQLREAFRGGDLLEAGNIAFAPAKETGVASAQEYLAIKVNPDTNAGVTLSNGAGAALDIEARDYGPHTNQISVSVAAGTAQGRRVTVTFEGLAQSRDNIGGVPLLTLQYREPPAVGWDAMTFQVIPAGIRASGTRAEAGRSTDLQNTPLNEAVRITSSSAADVTQIATVYALVGGVPTAIPLQLAGNAQVASTALVDAGSVFGVVLSAACAGTVVLSQATGPITLFSLAPGALSSGGAIGRGMFAQGALTMVADAAATAVVLFAGRNDAGAVMLETRALTGTTPVNTVATTWRQIDFVGMALVPAARTITFSGVAAQTANGVQSTLIRVRDFLNALQVVVSGTAYGFTAVINTTRATYSAALLDRMAAAVSGYFPASAGLLADNALIAEFLNSDTTLVTATIAANAQGAPANTATPVYLAGGTQGTALFADWQGAFTLARSIACDTIVVLTPDPAVMAALAEHLDYRAGPGRAEADGIVGMQNAAMTGLATRAEMRALISSLNNRNIRVIAQSIDRYDSIGERRTFAPHFAAVMLAGAQAGMGLDRSLTHCVVNALDFGQSTDWDPKDNIEELLEMGAVVLENEQGVGIRVVRDVTSNVGSDNPAFTDGQGNRIVNYVTRELRREVDPFIGKGALPAVTKGKARQRLNRFVSEEKCLKEWKDLVVSNAVDRLPVSVSISPNFAINFAPITIYLYDAPVTA